MFLISINSMRRCGFKVFYYTLVVISFLVILFHGDKYFLSLNAEKFQENLLLKSECECRQNKVIFLNSSQHNSFIDVWSLSNKKLLYSLSLNFVRESVFTCDLYNVFRRGHNSKVLAFSLYGNNSFYYKNLPALSRSIQTMYPGWIMRIYHDHSIDKNIKCQIECLRDQNGQLIDNADFCNINKLPGKGLSFNSHWSANYLHAMKWRWLPIGDSFVNVFSSRDTDSKIIPREVDAVNAWLSSDKAGHIMRGSTNLTHCSLNVLKLIKSI